VSEFRPIVAFIVTVQYDIVLYTLPAAAIVAGIVLVIFYHRKTIPEMVAIYFGLFLLIGGASLTALHYLFHLNVGRVEVVKYTGESPPGE
jgi:hypothetical protein